MRLTVVVPLALALAGVAGCHALRDDGCGAHQPYQSATSVPPLVAAEGGAAPSTRNALKIPELSAAPQPPKGRCLDQPPHFYDDSAKPAAASKAAPAPAPTAAPPPPPSPPAPSQDAPPGSH